MLDCDKEADAYDAVACGTGIVFRRLAAARPGTPGTGADLR
ncbi:hypothetical protein [Streptomyces sp. NPDC003015]